VSIKYLWLECLVTTDKIKEYTSLKVWYLEIGIAHTCGKFE